MADSEQQTTIEEVPAKTEPSTPDAGHSSKPSGPDMLRQLSAEISSEFGKKEEEKYVETVSLKTGDKEQSPSFDDKIGTMRSLIWNESAFDLPEARKYRVTGSFKDNWTEYLHQPFHVTKMMNHKGKEEEICFAEPLAPRRIFVALKVKRISDIDNVAETYRCRFHIYFDWLLTESDYNSYKKYHV